jgi:hypothetical protein
VVLRNGNLSDGQVVRVIHELVVHLAEVRRILVPHELLRVILQVLADDLKLGLVQVDLQSYVVRQIQLVHLVTFHGEALLLIDHPLMHILHHQLRVVQVV